MKSTLERLKEGRRVLAEMGWTKHWFARNERDITCGAHETGACKFCAIGALMYGMPFNLSVCEPLQVLRSVLPKEFDSVAEFNDSRESVAEVLVLYDDAIALLETA